MITTDIEVVCRDCRLPYREFGLDLVLPDQQWRAVCPEGGVLCATCICRRAAYFNATAVLAWLDNLDYALVPPMETTNAITR
jgi:hypothetical protein